MDAADIVLSLHRTEGFGLVPARGDGARQAGDRHRLVGQSRFHERRQLGAGGPTRWSRCATRKAPSMRPTRNGRNPISGTPPTGCGGSQTARICAPGSGPRRQPTSKPSYRRKPSCAGSSTWSAVGRGGQSLEGSVTGAALEMAPSIRLRSGDVVGDNYGQSLKLAQATLASAARTATARFAADRRSMAASSPSAPPACSVLPPRPSRRSTPCSTGILPRSRAGSN